MIFYNVCIAFLRSFRDPVRVPRIENRVPRISENYHRIPREKIGSHTGYLTFSLKTLNVCVDVLIILSATNTVQLLKILNNSKECNKFLFGVIFEKSALLSGPFRG